MIEINDKMTINIEGVGIIFYSPSFAKHIKEEEDYLTFFYSEETRVQAHIQEGTIVGFCLGSPGRYILKFKWGYPEQNLLQKSEFKLRLAINCIDGKICVRDLYDLLHWRSLVSDDQVLCIPNGIYHITLLSDIPSTGVLGDNQIIEVYFNPLQSFPKLSTNGVPHLVNP